MKNEGNRLFYVAMTRAEEALSRAAADAIAQPDVARRLKGDPRTAHIPVVALTGHALAGISEGAKKAGCDAFVTTWLGADTETVGGWKLIAATPIEVVSVTEVAARSGVSRQSVHRWLRRYAAQGLAGLVDQSTMPTACPSSSTG